MKVAIALILFIGGVVAAVMQIKPDSKPLPTPLIVYVTPAPTPTPTPIDMKKWVEDFEKANDNAATPKEVSGVKPIYKTNLDEKMTCWVDKNGSYEMTYKECLEMYEADTFRFQVNAYKACLGGHNPKVGGDGTPESRKQKCSEVTGISEK